MCGAYRSGYAFHEDVLRVAGGLHGLLDLGLEGFLRCRVQGRGACIAETPQHLPGGQPKLLALALSLAQ